VIDRVDGLTKGEVNERIDQINSELKRIRGEQNANILADEQPRNPARGQVWFGDGKIYLWNGSEIETYSKD